MKLQVYQLSGPSHWSKPYKFDKLNLFPLEEGMHATNLLTSFRLTISYE